MYTFLMVIQVLAAVALIGLILLQQGKGADAGAAFGSGASSTVFGARGSANFLSRTTAYLAAVFFAVSLGLAYLIHGTSGGAPRSIVDKMQQQSAPAPVTDEAPAAAPAAQPAAPAPAEAPKVPD